MDKSTQGIWGLDQTVLNPLSSVDRGESSSGVGICQGIHANGHFAPWLGLLFDPRALVPPLMLTAHLSPCLCATDAAIWLVTGAAG